MSVIGQRVPRTEDRRLLTSGGMFVADAPCRAGTYAHLGFVRSTRAHAVLAGVDATHALSQPGVLGVFVADDMRLGAMPPVMPTFPPELSQPVLAQDRVRYVGEAVAAVVVDDAGQLEDALELVQVRYDPLPAVIAPGAAALDETLLFPALGSNVVASRTAGSDDPGDLFDGCEVVVSDTVLVPRVAPCPLEARAAASVWDEAGRLHRLATTQAPHAVKAQLQAVLGLGPDAVHVLAGDVGGGFGPKFSCYPEDIVTAWAARHLARPVRWAETRSESMVGLHHGRGQALVVTIGGSRAGKVLAYRVDITQDAGAYASLGVYALDPTIRMASGAYDIPRVHATGRAVVTNTTPVGAYRGTGRPEAACAIEWAMDLFAAAIGRDPADVRRANLVRAFPFTTAVGTTYSSGDYQGALDLVLGAAAYGELRADQARRRAAGASPLVGIGVSVYVESAGAGPPREHASVQVRPDGTVVVVTGTSPHGQGHATTWSMIAAEVLGVALDRISVLHGDTDVVATGMGTFASRSVQFGGSAVHEAAGKVLGRGRALAAELLEAAPCDVVFDRDRAAFHVLGTPAAACTWGDVASAAGPGGIVEQEDFVGATTYPFGAHVAVVTIDAETGDTRLVRLVSVDDAGRLVNPVIAEGQRHGAIAQGVAEALFEEFRYAPDGTPVTTNFSDYAFVAASELPVFELVASETPVASNPLGAMGIGENGTVGSLAAVHNAVADAIAHLGARWVGIPATPERVWNALRTATKKG
jgi:carbon-monoxide dehydrogenase large subunit